MSEKKWKAAGSYVIGKSHERNNSVCQDRVCSQKENNVVCISLADGAGSAQQSQIGAEIVTGEICQHLVDNFDDFWQREEEILKKKILGLLLRSLHNKAQEMEIELKELSSTLLFVAVKNQHFIAGHIGDGVIATYDQKSCDVLSHPTNEDFSNVTVFVTSGNALETFQLYRKEISDITGFALMSDGTSDSFYSKKKKAVAPGLKNIFEWLECSPEDEVAKAITENLQELIRQKTDDDCSLNILSLGSDILPVVLSRPQKKLLNLFQSHSQGLTQKTIQKLLKIRMRLVKKHTKYLMEKGLIQKNKDTYILN